MKYNPFYLLSFLLLTLSGCIDEYDADIAAEDSNLLVVEGTICSAELNKFYLSRTQDIKATYGPRMVTGASAPLVPRTRMEECLGHEYPG